MKPARERMLLVALGLLALVLAGPSECRAVDAISTAPSQVATAIYVQQWGQVLWGLVTNQTGTQPAFFGDPIFNPDGSVSQSFVAADGTEALLTAFLDGSARIDLLLPNGTTQTVAQSVPSFDGVTTTTIEWSVASSDGTSVEYTSVVDDRGTIFDASDDITQLVGSSLLPGGLTQAFSVLTSAGIADVWSAQSDGSTFGLTVPLGLPDLVLPSFSAESFGTYKDPHFEIGFTLVSTPRHPQRWAALLTDVGGQLAGTFSLDRDFSGFGQLEESSAFGPRLAALLTWTRDGEVHAYLLTGQDLHMGPAGAALDFLEHRWETLTALLAPSAAGSARVVPGHRRLRRAPRPRAAGPGLPGALRGTVRAPGSDGALRYERAPSAPRTSSSPDGGRSAGAR